MFDYIIVGAGSAGCVLANRLSENQDARVLLLEAGKCDNRPEIHIPAAFSRLFRTNMDWAYETEPQTELKSRSLFWPRGKVLGGSSSINAMIYIRGHRADYDRWAAQGCEGWGYTGVLPYFKRSEDNVRGASTFHGRGGPLRVENQRDPNPLSEVFVEASQQTGLPHNDDFNGAEQEGAGLYQVNQRGGRRESAATAFLGPALSRPNLVVETGATVTQVLFEGTRARGVAYVQDDQKLVCWIPQDEHRPGATYARLPRVVGKNNPAELLRERTPVAGTVPVEGTGRALYEEMVDLIRSNGDALVPVWSGDVGKKPLLVSWMCFEK